MLPLGAIETLVERVAYVNPKPIASSVDIDRYDAALSHLSFEFGQCHTNRSSSAVVVLFGSSTNSPHRSAIADRSGAGTLADSGV